MKGWHKQSIRHSNAKQLGRAGPAYKRNPDGTPWGRIRVTEAGSVKGIPAPKRKKREPIKKIHLSRVGEAGTTASDILRVYRSARGGHVNKPRNEEEIRSANERFYAIRETEDGPIIGVAAIRIRTGEIQKFFLKPAYRGRNFGLSTVRKLESISKKSGRDSTIMFVKPGNTSMVNLLGKYGYRLTGWNDEHTAKRFEREFPKVSERPFRFEEKV